MLASLPPKDVMKERVVGFFLPSDLIRHPTSANTVGANFFKEFGQGACGAVNGRAVLFEHAAILPTGCWGRSTIEAQCGLKVLGSGGMKVMWDKAHQVMPGVFPKELVPDCFGRGFGVFRICQYPLVRKFQLSGVPCPFV